MTPEQVAAHQQRVRSGLKRTASAIAERVEKRTKYGNKKCEEDGYMFDSNKERQRYRELRLMERAKLITALRVHPKYPLRVNKEIIGDYIADFEYQLCDELVIEDVKGFKTDVYRWKAKHFTAQYGFPVREVT